MCALLQADQFVQSRLSFNEHFHYALFQTQLTGFTRNIGKTERIARVVLFVFHQSYFNYASFLE